VKWADQPLLLLPCPNTLRATHNNRQALELSRQERYEQARGAFEVLLQTHPTFCKAWVSYAQVSCEGISSSAAWL
jgi:hypothetical protein